MSRFVCLLALALVGCTPIVPFHLLETAETLGKQQIALTVGGGGGGARGSSECCGGGAARLRVGVGHRLELGVDTTMIGAGGPGGGSLTLGGKLALKYGLSPFVALLFGAGASGSIGLRGQPSGELGIGGDAGVVGSTPLVARRLRIYGGLRFSFVVPAARDVFGAGGPTEAIVAPLGLSVSLGAQWRLFAEAGYLGGWSHNRTTAPTGSRQVDTLDWYGGYGAVAVSWVYAPRR